MIGMSGMKTKQLVILVVDENMAAMFRGYFSRPQWHLSLGCADFKFDPGDILVEPGNDPGVYTRAHDFLRPYLSTHQHALVALDCEWEGAPRRMDIIAHISHNLMQNGWPNEAARVIAIEPELENWLWQDNPIVSEVLRYRQQPNLRNLLEQQGIWPKGLVKPPRPKEAAEWVLKQTRQPRSSAIYAALAGRISIKNCTDPAFLDVQAALQAWFPANA
jgi:hypothetical protein